MNERTTDAPAGVPAGQDNLASSTEVDSRLVQGEVISTSSTDPVLSNPPAPPQAPEQSNVPRDLQGLSFEELAEKYQSVRKSMGRQANELGDLRKAVEQMQQQPEPEPDGDFFDNPAEHLERIIDKKLQPLIGSISANRAEAVATKLDSDHPGWRDTVAGEEFQAWVAEDPGRTRLYQEADQQFNYTSATTLIKTWDELNSEMQQSEERAEVARAARTESGGPVGRRGRRFSAGQLQHMKATQPAQYEAMLPDIMAAYRDGRVDR